MKNEDIVDKVSINFDKCVSIIEKCFPTHMNKIEFLKLSNENCYFINDKKEYQEIKDAINMLVINAKEEMSRKQQQQKLMPIITLISTENDIEKIDQYFQKEKYLFSLYCLMNISFLYEKSLNEHGNKYHSHILVALDKTSNDLIKLNTKKERENEKHN